MVPKNLFMVPKKLTNSLYFIVIIFKRAVVDITINIKLLMKQSLQGEMQCNKFYLFKV